LFVCLEAVHLQRAGELLTLVKLSTKAVREHLVDSEISQESIVFFQKSAFVFELLEVPLEFVKANYLSNARHIHASQLVLKRADRILGKHAHSRVLFGRVKWSRKGNHSGLRTGLLGHTLHSESHMDAVILISQQLVSLLLLGLTILLKGSHRLGYLFQI
jgi:hypothetical protein